MDFFRSADREKNIENERADNIPALWTRQGCRLSLRVTIISSLSAARTFPIVSNWREARLRTIHLAYIIRFRSSSCTCSRGIPWNLWNLELNYFLPVNISRSAFRALPKEETLLSRNVHNVPGNLYSLGMVLISLEIERVIFYVNLKFDYSTECT